MVSKTMKLVNAQGLHMRPAQMFAAEMKNFECDVNLECNGKKANGKSLMMIKACAMKCGMEVNIQCDGPDEEAALAKAVELIESGFGED